MTTASHSGPALDVVVEAIANCKEDLLAANQQLTTALDNVERDRSKLLEELSTREKELDDRLEVLREEMLSAAEKYGNANVSSDDELEINAGGKIIVTTRSTLTRHTNGTKLGALFSGRWDAKLQRDTKGRIFLDVNPECFQAIMTYLNEYNDKDQLDLPSLDDEYVHILWQQIDMFGIWGKVIKPRFTIPTNSIVLFSNACLSMKFHHWSSSQGLAGYFSLRYRSTRDGLSRAALNKRLNKNGSFIFIIQADEESLSPTSVCGRSPSSQYGRSPSSQQDSSRFDCTTTSIVRVGKFSATERDLFGRRMDGDTSLRPSVLSSYQVLDKQAKGVVVDCGWEDASIFITLLEVFEIFGPSMTTNGTTARKRQEKYDPVTRFHSDINEAINRKQQCLPQTELKVRKLEDSFREESLFMNTFVSGDAKDVITLNVRGTLMTTKRSTLRIIEDSVLAQQFDDSKWTEQGYTNMRVKRWTVDDVCAWVNNIEGIAEEVGIIFKKNGVTGCELLALNFDGLKMMGIERAGTICLLQKEIEGLVKACQDVVTLIDHCPYCFGKILDFLRLKQLYVLGLAKEEPALPYVQEEHKQRFEKVVNFYFPGDVANLILGV